MSILLFPQSREKQKKIGGNTQCLKQKLFPPQWNGTLLSFRSLSGRIISLRRNGISKLLHGLFWKEEITCKTMTSRWFLTLQEFCWNTHTLSAHSSKIWKKLKTSCLSHWVSFLVETCSASLTQWLLSWKAQQCINIRKKTSFALWSKGCLFYLFRIINYLFLFSSPLGNAGTSKTILTFIIYLIVLTNLLCLNLCHNEGFTSTLVDS